MFGFSSGNMESVTGVNIIDLSCYGKTYLDILSDVFEIIQNIIKGSASISTSIIKNSLQCRIEISTKLPTMIILYEIPIIKLINPDLNFDINEKSTFSPMKESAKTPYDELNSETCANNSHPTSDTDTTSDINTDTSESLHSYEKGNSNKEVKNTQSQQEIMNQQEGSQQTFMLNTPNELRGKKHLLSMKTRSMTSKGDPSDQNDELGAIEGDKRSCITLFHRTPIRRPFKKSWNEYVTAQRNKRPKINEISRYREKVHSHYLNRKQKQKTKTAEDQNEKQANKSDQILAGSSKNLETSQQSKATTKTVLSSSSSKEPTEKPFRCRYCAKTFSHKCNMQTHEANHTGDKPYPCNYCDKSFTCRGHKDRHERTHTGEKPFQCSFCGRNFSHKCNKETHERKHTGEKPYSCSHCEKAFSYKSSLETHERSHTGEKPYRCTYCNKCFSDRSGKIKHEKIHTGAKQSVAKEKEC